MQIAELYRNQTCLEELTGDLPEGIEYDRDSECLRLSEAFDETASWGPFRFELVRSPTEAHLAVRTSDPTQLQGGEVRLYVRLKVNSERWLMLLDFADTDEGSGAEAGQDEEPGSRNISNTAIVVDVQQQTLYLKAQRPLLPGERLTTRLCSSSSNSSGNNNNSYNEEELAIGDDSVEPEDAPQQSEDGTEENQQAEQPQLQLPMSPICRRKRPASASDIDGGSGGGDGVSAKQPRLQASAARRSAAQAESALRSKIRYCGQCGLFFTSAWMLQTHRQFHELFDSMQQQQTSQRDSPQLVLSAPVLSDRGSIAYIPVGLPRVADSLKELQTASANSETDGSSPELAEATALDLTLPRLPTPAASSRQSQAQQLSRQRVRLSQQQQQQQQALDFQQQQEQNQPGKSGSVSSLMSVCKDCKIGFFNYNNYVVHRSLYCQGSRLGGGPASSTPSRALPKQPLQQQQQQPSQEPPQPPAKLPPAVLATPKLEAVATPTVSAAMPAGASANSPTASSSSERKFQCPYCQIRFHSPSTLTAHQAFYCPENPDKAAPSAAASATAGAAAASPAPAANETAAAAASGDSAVQCHQQQQPPPPQQPPSWLPISLDLSGSAGYRCTACGYIGQTERGMKMHAKVHSGGGSSSFGGHGASSSNNGPSSSTLSPPDASAGADIRLPTSFSSDMLSNMTPEELGMLQHKTQPYSKRRTFKRMPPTQTLPQQPPPQPQQLQLPLSLHPSLLRHQLHQLQQQQQVLSAGAAAAAAVAAASSAHGGFRLAPACRRDSGGDDAGQWPLAKQPQGQLVCVRCGESFDQLETLLEHQETACPGLNAAAAAAAAAVEAAAAAVKLESVRTVDGVSRV